MELVPIRIHLYSNYDCINSHYFETFSTGGYEYYESYFGAVIDALNLNPRKVKKLFNEKGINMYGRWPNKSTRDGKELVDYDKFWEEDENRGCPACHLVIAGMVNPKDFNKEYTRIKIPRWNTIGFFSDSYGGGSHFGLELINDTIISIKPGETKYDRWELVKDDENGYDIEGTFDVHRDFFGKQIELLK